MQKLYFIVALSLALPIIAQAQEAPRVQMFGGYSYMRLEDNNIDGQDRDLAEMAADVGFDPEPFPEDSYVA